jgi:hypothetical protein
MILFRSISTQRKNIQCLFENPKIEQLLYTKSQCVKNEEKIHT